jgi:hypothetical protein
LEVIVNWEEMDNQHSNASFPSCQPPGVKGSVIDENSLELSEILGKSRKLSTSGGDDRLNPSNVSS